MSYESQIQAFNDQLIHGLESVGADPDSVADAYEDELEKIAGLFNMLGRGKALLTRGTAAGGGLAQKATAAAGSSLQSVRRTGKNVADRLGTMKARAGQDFRGGVAGRTGTAQRQLEASQGASKVREAQRLSAATPKGPPVAAPAAAVAPKPAPAATTGLTTATSQKATADSMNPAAPGGVTAGVKEHLGIDTKGGIDQFKNGWFGNLEDHQRRNVLMGGAASLATGSAFAGALATGGGKNTVVYT